MRIWLFLAALLVTGPVSADEQIRICHGYGCLVEADIRYSQGQLGEVRRRLFAATDAADERRILAEVVGRLYAWAGEQSDIHNDRGGNYDDAGIPGKMDCIDHSTSTTRLLKMLAERGYLRWHSVLEPEVRYFAFVLPNHYAAVVKENDGDDAARFVVDSWFVDNGQPAVILPLSDWKKGAGPDV